ncbi:MAG: hypothetical protein QOI80_2198 [Solirubrobacteraceae bacterium]|jgi:heme O synthase-like polyprenyltransferase|nr:hypothetical protein [Solirubrobacteraceae bacterium]
MSIQPDTDRQLAKTSGRLAANGGKLLAVAAVLDVLGAILLITGASPIIGWICLALSFPVILAAVGLIGSGAVGKRASEQKPFA